MLNQALIIDSIFEAKKFHLKWLKRVDHLVSGLPVDEKRISIEPTECNFGKWLYLDAAKLRLIPKLQSIYDRIEYHHNEVHDAYMEIYRIYFVIPKRNSFLQKFIPLERQNISAEAKQQAKAHYKYLKKSSEELMTVLDVLEDMVKELEYADMTHIV